MRAIPCLLEIEDCPAGHHLAAMTDERLEHFLQRQQPGLAVHQRNHIDAEDGLERRLRIEVVQHDFRVLAAAQLNHDAHAILVGFVAQPVRGDAFKILLAHQVSDPFDQPRLVDLVGQLGNDDRLTIAAPTHVLEMRASANRKPTAPALVSRGNFLSAVDDAGRREVRTRHQLHQVSQPDVGFLDYRETCVDDLGEIVRWDVGGHAHRNARGAVDQQVGDPGRQYRRLHFLAVIVRDEIDCGLVDIRQQFTGDALETALRIAHGCRRVAIHRAEIALTVDQGIAQRKVLRHADQCVVDRRIAMGVVLAHDIADHACALYVGPVPAVAGFMHREQDPPMHGLQAVAHVRQCPADDDAHGVIEIRPAHLVFKVYGENLASDISHQGKRNALKKEAEILP